MVFGIAGLLLTVGTGAVNVVDKQVIFSTDLASNVYNEGLADFDVKVYQYDNYGMYLDKSGEPVVSTKLSLNNTIRFDLPSQFTNVITPWETHTNTPHVGIHTYPFALKPECICPTGYSNFIKLSVSQKLQLTINPEIADGTTNFNVGCYVISYSIILYNPAI